jgi:hypothetical protein
LFLEYILEPILETMVPRRVTIISSF